MYAKLEGSCCCTIHLMMPKKSGKPVISAIFCHFLQFCGHHKMNSTVDSTLRFCVPYLLMVFFWFQKYFSRIFAHKIANSKNSHFRANFLSNLHVKFWWEIAGTKNCRRALKFWHDLSLMLDRILQCTPSEFSKKVEIRPTLLYTEAPPALAHNAQPYKP